MLTVAITVEEIETRVSGFVARANAIIGTEKAISYPACIAWAGRQLGVSLANIRSVSDAELETVSNIDALFDLAELKALETTQTNLSDVTIKAGPVSEDWNDLSKRIADIIASKREAIAVQHGIYLSVELLDTQLRISQFRSL